MNWEVFPCSISWETLHRININSSLNLWKNSLLKSSESEDSCWGVFNYEFNLLNFQTHQTIYFISGKTLQFVLFRKLVHFIYSCQIYVCRLGNSIFAILLMSSRICSDTPCSFKKLRIVLLFSLSPLVEVCQLY